jgi:hypothetical protein
MRALARLLAAAVILSAPALADPQPGALLATESDAGSTRHPTRTAASTTSRAAGTSAGDHALPGVDALGGGDRAL